MSERGREVRDHRMNGRVFIGRPIRSDAVIPQRLVDAAARDRLQIERVRAGIADTETPAR